MDYTGQSLGYGQGSKLPEQPLGTDFAKKFPPDPTLGKEMEETARVWKVYRAEAEAHDGAMVDGWNKTLDVLLIFAGLFSAVATAFLIDSYKLLQPDISSAYMSTALYLLVLRDNVSSPIPLPPPPPLETSTSTIARAVNWLWFTSLLLSLSVALLGILIKQWIVEYTSRNTVSAESPRHWAVRHRMSFHAMITWPVADLVSVLPVMLHASLFLFFAGVALFVWNLDIAIGVWVAVLGLLLGVFYMACSLLPIWVPECPTSTPLVHLVRRYFLSLKIITLDVRVYLSTRITAVRASARWALRILPLTSIAPRDNSDDDGQSHTVQHLTSEISLLRARHKRPLTPYVPEERVDALTADGLRWLMFSVADSDARAVGLQALGAVPSYGALAEHLRYDPRLTQIGGLKLFTRSTGGLRPVESTRIFRTMLWTRDNSSAPEMATDFDLWIHCFSSDCDYPDMLFLDAVRKTLWEREEGNIPPPPHVWHSASISSTVLLFLRARHLDFNNLVSALLWCNFGVLLVDDWTFVLERIVSEGSTRTSLLLLPRTDPLVCIIDVLAQCIMQSAAVRNNMMVHQLLIALLERTVLKFDYDRTNFSSFLSAYLLSDSFAEQLVQPDVLHNFFVMAILVDASRVAEAYPPAVETYFSLLNSLLPLLLRQQVQVPNITCVLSARALYAYNAPNRTQSGGVLSLTLRRILMPTERQPLRSLWDIFRDSKEVGLLVMALVQTLCLADRAKEDISAMVDVFLSHLSLQDLFLMHKSMVGYFRRTELTDYADFQTWIACIIQCCVELRPTWWFDSLTALREDERADPELKQHLSELETISLYRVPCDFCHRLPLGWEEDGDPPASCGFNPAVPYLSTPHDRLSAPDARVPRYCPLCQEYYIGS